MAYTVTVETLPELTIGSVRTTTTLDQIPAQLEAGFGAIFGGLASHGHQPVGAPMTIYHRMSDDGIDMQIAIPCAPGAAAGDITVSTLSAVEAAVTVHTGPYDQMQPAYQALEQWMADNGHEPAGPPREVYITDPSELAPEDVQTRIEWPIC